MHNRNNIIVIILDHEGNTYQVQTREGEYESLMCLISEHLPLRSFGICYGGGCCGICGVMINDNDTGLKKFILSCEVQIDDEIANSVVTIYRV